MTGLLLGLLIAGGIYGWRAGQGRAPAEPPQAERAPTTAPEPLAQSQTERGRSGEATNDAARDAPAGAAATEAGDAASAASDKRFQFYEMLPSFEVVIPEERERVAAPPAATQPLERPGVYILQAGSYRAHADADRARAQLALLGVTAQIQRVVVGESEYHRVRVGPLSDLGQVNQLRDRLRQNNIEAIVIRVGE